MNRLIDVLDLRTLATEAVVFIPALLAGLGMLAVFWLTFRVTVPAERAGARRGDGEGVSRSRALS